MCEPKFATKRIAALRLSILQDDVDIHSLSQLTRRKTMRDNEANSHVSQP